MSSVFGPKARAELASLARRFATYPDLPRSAADALVKELCVRFSLDNKNFGGREAREFIDLALVHADQGRKDAVYTAYLTQYALYR